MNKELWKPVVGYEGYYDVSSFGNVRSYYKTNISIRDKDGKVKSNKYSISKKARLLTLGYSFLYRRIQLTKNGKAKAKGVHRLVAEAFISNPENKPSVNHLDSNPNNNHVNNLEWCTNKENSKHSRLYGNFNINGYHTKLNKKQVRVIKHCLNMGMKGYKLAKIFNITKSNISSIKNCKTWKNVII